MELYNLEAEKALLSAIIANGNVLDSVRSEISFEDFYDDNNKKIFRIMVENDTTDLVELSDKSGLSSYLVTVCSMVTTPGSLQKHLQIVRDKATLRRIRRSSQEILESLKSNDTSEVIKKFEESTAETQAKITLYKDRGVKKGDILHISEKQKEALNSLINKDEIVGLTFGLRGLDKLTRGFDKGEIFVIGGQTGHGKSMLMQKLALTTALNDKPVMYLSLEMTVTQQTARFYSMMKESCSNPVEKVSGLPIYFYNGTEMMSLKLLDNIIAKAKEECGIQLLCIDHLHYFAQSTDNMTNEIGVIIRTIKNYAKKYDIPILVISTLRKLTAKKSPTINDLRDSGMISFDADLIALIDREEINDSLTNELMIKLVKNRNRGTMGVSVVDITENYDLKGKTIDSIS